MKNSLKRMFKSANAKRIAMVTTLGTVALSATTAFASTGTGTADQSVTDAFTSLKGDVVATLGTVAALGVGVLGIFLAWKYGKKIFNRVAN